MPQNVVSGSAMKIEVGKHEVHQVGLAFESHGVFTELQVDFRSSEPSMSVGLNDCTNVTVLASRALGSSKVFSVSSCLGTSTPASRAAAPLARSAAIWIWRTNGSMSGARCLSC